MKPIALKLLFLANYIFFILHLCWLINDAVQLNIKNIVPFLVSSLMLIDTTYISACNIRENKIILLFCGLLALESWYVILSFEENRIAGMVFSALSPLIWYASVKFILMFLFQSSGYRFRKAVNLILLMACIGSLIGICISAQIFALIYGIQFVINTICFFFIIFYHWKRTFFVLKSEWKYILPSIVIITTLFVIYYFVTMDIQGHIANFGIYLPVMLFFISVHRIVHKEHSGIPLSTIFNKKQFAFIVCAMIVMLGLITLAMGGEYGELIIYINVLFVFIYISNIVAGYNLKKGESRIVKESKYNAAVRQLQQEEWLKTEFANFLHDDVLQDLLSIKNMMTKAQRPNIQDIIIKRLEDLNTHIRKQMQDYHPILLKNLTAKENYQNLLESISQTFPEKNMIVFFECSDNLFLVEPYNVLIYRLIKELLTNVYKHSNGNRAWITLLQESGTIKLCVSDDGTAGIDCLISADKTEHKGVSSIQEQVNRMEGSMIITNNTLQGICVQITIPMKGEVSYQYFISG